MAKIFTNEQKNYLYKYIYYLNIDEIKKISKDHNIPIHMYYKQQDKIKKSNYMLHKKDIIDNFLKFIEGKKINKKILSSKVVNFTKNDNPKASDILYFGQYTYMTGVKLLENLTNNIFKNGYVARYLLYKLWVKGKPFTYKYFANYYTKYHDKYDKMEHKEWAYCNDLKIGTNIDNWKKYRKNIAKIIIKLLS